MKKYFLLICLLAMPLIALAQGKVPQFKDYSVNEIYRGKNAPVKITKEDRDYRTRLKILLRANLILPEAILLKLGDAVIVV
jgi:hypothetical protein